MSELSRLSAQIDQASGEPRARLLVRRATLHMQAGALSPALKDLDLATELHAQGERPQDRVRCMHLAATAARLSGDLDGAYRRAIQALDLAPPQSSLAVSCLTELGETARARGDSFMAAGRYAQALSAGEAAGMLHGPRAALLQRQAQAWVETGNPSKAAAVLGQAAELLTLSGDLALAARTRLEQASAWASMIEGDRDNLGLYAGQARTAIQHAERQAHASAETSVLADIALLRSTLALADGDPQAALEQAREGQRLSLLATAPISYTTATLAISKLSEHLGDKLSSYGALAVGWVTLGDLMGKDVAQSTFEPKLQGLLQRWGQDEFVRVRDRYNER